MTLLGTWLGHYEIVAKNIDVIAVVMVLVSVVPWVVEFLKRRRKAAAADSAAPGTATVDPTAGPAAKE